MANIIISLHITLDGFVAGPNGEMDWINLADEMFDYVGHLTDNADTALYGRKTFEMMDAYWPTAADKPNASNHDKQHSSWYNKVNKYVLSNTMKGKYGDKIKFINDDLETKLKFIKEQSTNNILVFGSPSAIHFLFSKKLVDEIYLFVNPVLLGEGIPLFKDVEERQILKLISCKTFDSCNVVCLHYSK